MADTLGLSISVGMIAKAERHAAAALAAPDTELPIREGGRHILRAMRPTDRRR